MKRGIGALVAIAVAAGLAVPAAAQLRTDSSVFLEAVEKRDGDKVMAMLGGAGSTLINTRDLGNGRTVLHIVVQRQDLAWLKFLIQRGANPNIADLKGVTPLQVAAQLGFAEGVEALAEGGAQVDVTDKTGDTPLIAAIQRRDLAIVSILLESGANPLRTDNTGRSALDYARQLGKGSAILEAIEKAHSRKGQEAKTYGPN